MLTVMSEALFLFLSVRPDHQTSGKEMLIRTCQENSFVRILEIINRLSRQTIK